MITTNLLSGLRKVRLNYNYLCCGTRFNSCLVIMDFNRRSSREYIFPNNFS